MGNEMGARPLALMSLMSLMSSTEWVPAHNGTYRAQTRPSEGSAALDRVNNYRGQWCRCEPQRALTKRGVAG